MILRSANAIEFEIMKNQLLIVLVERLGGEIEMPVSEIDATGDKIMTMEIDQDKSTFTFSISKKN